MSAFYCLRQVPLQSCWVCQMPLSLDSDDNSGWVKNDRRPYRATIHFNDETHSFQTCVQRQPFSSRDYRCHGRSAAVKAMARPSVQLRKGVLNVGSDCSGLGTDVLCLRKMLKDSKAVLQHRFSSDTNVHCRAVLESLGLRPSERMQDPSAVPAVDLYSCGFPCQPYSLLE